MVAAVVLLFPPIIVAAVMDVAVAARRVVVARTCSPGSSGPKKTDQKGTAPPTEFRPPMEA